MKRVVVGPGSDVGMSGCRELVGRMSGVGCRDVGSEIQRFRTLGGHAILADFTKQAAGTSMDQQRLNGMVH